MTPDNEAARSTEHAQQRIEQYAELTIHGSYTGDDVDPVSLTDLLGVAPTRTWRRGEPLSPGRTRPSTYWRWSTEKSLAADSETVIVEVLDTFEPARQALLRAAAEQDLLLQINLVIWMYGEVVTEDDGETWIDIPTPALALSANTVRRLASFNCNLDVDQYVVPPD